MLHDGRRLVAVVECGQLDADAADPALQFHSDSDFSLNRRRPIQLHNKILYYLLRLPLESRRHSEDDPIDFASRPTRAPDRRANLANDRSPAVPHGIAQPLTALSDDIDAPERPFRARSGSDGAIKPSWGNTTAASFGRISITTNIHPARPGSNRRRRAIFHPLVAEAGPAATCFARDLSIINFCPGPSSPAASPWTLRLDGNNPAGKLLSADSAGPLSVEKSAANSPVRTQVVVGCGQLLGLGEATNQL